MAFKFVGTEEPKENINYTQVNISKTQIITRRQQNILMMIFFY